MKKKVSGAKEILRSEVPWLPTSSSSSKKLSENLSSLAMFHEKNDIVPPVPRKNVRRLRAKSMLAIRKNNDDQSNEVNQFKFSIDEMHAGSHKKQQRAASDWEKLREEFKKRIDSNSSKK